MRCRRDYYASIECADCMIIAISIELSREESSGEERTEENCSVRVAKG